jgi:hypothetical protein
MNYEVFCQTLKPFIQDGNYGFKDMDENIVIDPEYDFVLEFCEGCKLTVVANGKYYQPPDPEKDPGIYFTGKFGLMDFKGTLLIPPVFDAYLEIGEDYAIMGEGSGVVRFDHWPNVSRVYFEGVSGAINTEGDTIIPFIMSQIKQMKFENKKVWIVNQSDREGYSIIDKEGHNLVYEFYDEIHEPKEGLVRIKKENKYGFIDTNGMTIIPPIYNNATDFSESLASVQLDDEYFMIYSTGSKACNVPFRYDSLYSYSEGFAKVKFFDKYGFIDKYGYFFNLPEYTVARTFFNGLATVETGTEFGYLYVNGNKDLTKKYNDDHVDLLSGKAESFLYEQKIDLEELNDTMYYFHPVKDWDLKTLILFSLEAIRWAPYLYYQYPQMLSKVIAGEGTLSGRFILNRNFWDPGNEKWENCKKSVLFPILSSEESRIRLWEWIKPAFKEIWLSMPTLHRKNYHELLTYLESYFSEYNRDEILDYLKSNESEFAYYHSDGSKSPYRKTSALIDRLILIHDVISEYEAVDWVKEVHRSVTEWDEIFEEQ